MSDKSRTWRGKPLTSAPTQDLQACLRIYSEDLPVDDRHAIEQELARRERKVTFSMAQVAAERRKRQIERYRYMLDRMDKTGLGFWPKDPHGEDYGSDPDIETEPELMTRSEVSHALAALAGGGAEDV